MIVLTRLNGARFAINDEQIERLEEAPNTIVVLVNGNRYPVLESLQEIIDTIVGFRAHVIDVASKGEISDMPGRQPNLALIHSKSGDDSELPPFHPEPSDNPFRRPLPEKEG